MTYEYLCTLCAHIWEAEQSIKEEPLKLCPSCGKEGAKRQVSGGAGFILKGGGWYADGYGSKSAEQSSAPKAKPVDGTPKTSETTASSSKESTSGTGGSESSSSTKPSA